MPALSAEHRVRLADALTASRSAALAIVVFSVAVNLLTLATPIYMLQIFDRLIASRSVESLAMLTLIVIVALTALSALHAIRSLILVRIGRRIDRLVGEPLFVATVGEHVGGGSRGARPLSDLATLRSFLTGSAALAALDAPWSVMFIAVVFLLHPLLGWIAVAGALALFALALLGDAATRSLNGRAQRHGDRARRQAETLLSNAQTAEAMGMVPALSRHWRAHAASAADMLARVGARRTLIRSGSKFVSSILLIATLCAGVWLVITDAATPGVLVAATILVRRAVAPAHKVVGAWRSMVSARNAYHNVARQLDRTVSRGSAIPPPNIRGELRVENLKFRRPNARHSLFREVSFTLRPGEALALVGPIGAGKSTLAQLLVGSLAPSAGHVRIDGIDIAFWDRAALGRRIGYLPQDPALFDGTVRQNIARMADGDLDAVLHAARLAGVHDVLVRLPKGYDTECGADSAALSRGEARAVALARALYGRPMLVVLDDPHVGFDANGEAVLAEILARLKADGATVIIIVQSPKLVAQCDKVLVLSEGAARLVDLRAQDEHFGLGELLAPARAAERVERING